MRQIMTLVLSKESAVVNEKTLKDYIEKISQSYQWGSVIEIIGFAMMVRGYVRVWQYNEDRKMFFTIDKVKHTDSTMEPIDLYFSRNHYDLMISSKMYEALVHAYPFLKDRVVKHQA
jgi:hypothetical protein